MAVQDDDVVGLSVHRATVAKNLPYGAQRHLKIARFLAGEPSLLLVEQNAHMALSIAHRGYVLETGTVALTGAEADLADNEQMRSAYLGE